MHHQALRYIPAGRRLEIEDMARVFTDELLHHAERLLNDEMTLTETARELCVNADNLSTKLRQRGVKTRGRTYRPAHNAKDYPRSMVKRLHTNGWSVKKMSEHFGATRAAIRSQLLRDGVQPRNRSQALLARMASTPKQERQRLAAAAHAAVRGEKRSIEELSQRAKRQTRLVGEGEEFIAEALRQRGIEFVAQAPVHIYNVDLLVGAVAVEPGVRSGDPLRDPKRLQRTEELIRRGLHVLWITYRELAALHGCLEYVLADIDALNRDPSAPREYRVVRCSAHRFTRARNERGQLSAVPAPVRFQYARRR